MYSDEERREKESTNMSPTKNRPFVRPSIRPHEHVRSVKTVKKLYSLEIPPILEKKHDMRNNRQDRNLPCHLPTPLRFRESIEKY